MIYSSQRAQAIQKKDIAFLTAGIHDNITLDSIRIDKSINGNYFIEMKFISEDGKYMTHTEWEPTKSPNMTDDDLQRKCDNQFKRFDQILECYYPNAEDRAFLGESFKGLIDWISEKLNAANKNTKLRLKVVYNDRGYTTLPRYCVYKFIEPMSIVEAGKSVIVKLGIDNFEKPVVADTETANPNPLTTGFTIVNATMDNTEDPNGLPF